MDIFKGFSLKKLGLGLAIVIVFNMFVNYGINAFYEAPKYEDFCSSERLKKPLNTRESCEGIGGLWSETSSYDTKRYYDSNGVEKPIATTPIIEIQGQQPTGSCDQDFTCRKDYDREMSVYSRNVFVVWVIVGVIAIVGSFFFTAVSALSTSFMFAGIISLLIGNTEYWWAMQDYLRFVILGIALSVLIYVGYRKLKE